MSTSQMATGICLTAWPGGHFCGRDSGHAGRHSCEVDGCLSWKPAEWEQLPARVEIEKLMVELDETGLREFQSEMLDVVYAGGEDERFARILRSWHKR